MSLNNKTMTSMNNYLNFKKLLNKADAIVIGAGAGLSTSAGLHYSGKRFEDNFKEYIERYKLTDMYTAAFYPHNSLEEMWGYWCKHIYHNRYEFEPNDTYELLLNLIKDKNYFVITTNGDHLFPKTGFNKERLYYMQGDYGVWQCSRSCTNDVYDNKDSVLKMLDNLEDLKIPSSLIPYCPKCGSPLSMYLRCDDTFVETDKLLEGRGKYHNFLNSNLNKKVLFIDLGTGGNTPGIIKYPFWQMTYDNKNALYISVNLKEAVAPIEIKKKSLLFNEDIRSVLKKVSEIEQE